MVIDPEIVKLATGSVTVDNSSGTSDLTQDNDIVIGELNKILTVLSVYVVGTATINSVSISGNKVTVNATVPAGKTATINVTVAGN